MDAPYDQALDAASKAMEAGNPRAAARALVRAIRCNPARAHGWHLLGLALGIAGHEKLGRWARSFAAGEAFGEQGMVGRYTDTPAAASPSGCLMPITTRHFAPGAAAALHGYLRLIDLLDAPADYHATPVPQADWEAMPSGSRVLCLLADPDILQQELAALAALAARKPHAWINHPAQVLALRRHALPGRLAGLEELVVPQAIRHEPGTPLDSFDCPAVVRPCGSHGGRGLRLVDTPLALQEHVRHAGHPLYISRYVEFGDPEGWYEKTRLLFIGEGIFVEHVYLGREWIVNRASHERICRAPDAQAGARHRRAIGKARARLASSPVLRQLRRRIGLDIFAVDLAWLPDGRILIFECNAVFQLPPLSATLACEPELAELHRDIQAGLRRFLAGRA